MTEGYIKFDCDWQKEEFPFSGDDLRQLETARTKLYKSGLIGMYPDGIGFGNISAKSGESTSFIITGSATGKFEKLDQSHYSLVSRYDFEKNSITCSGLTKASAESLTHAAVYESLPEIGAVIHVHCLWLWEKLLNIYPTTSAEIEYGTPEMAFAVGKLASEINGRKVKVIVMGGHREGILAFGSNLTEVTNEIIKIFNLYQND